MTTLSLCIYPSLASTCVKTGAVPSVRRPYSETAPLVVSTQLQQVADSFESVLQASQDNHHIPVDSLLDACRTLLNVMQHTGPKALARDFENNIRKIESAAYTDPTRTHTVTSLLQHERDSGVHRQGNESSLYLREQSGAMGLLWIRRTLAFQSDFYERLLEDDNADPIDAIHHAYQQQLKPYHGWTLAKCYNLLVKNNMPPRRLLLARVGGYDDQYSDDASFYEKKTCDELKRLVALWRPLIQKWKWSFVELGMEDTRRA